MANKTDHQLCIKGAQTHCDDCSGRLCIRQQTINLALGHIDEMFCLRCLGKSYKRDPAEILDGVKTYILTRPCFKNEWVKCRDESDCAAPESCYPGVCIQEEYDEE